MLPLLLALQVATQAPVDYAPCAHRPDEPGPATTPAEQELVRGEIRDAVAELGGSPAFAQYLIAVATRESSLRPGVIHVGDAEHYTAAYRYKRKAHERAGNPFAKRPELWLSFGLFGLNSNYYTRLLHPHADPRQLCSVRVSVATYALAAQSVLRRLPRGCGIRRPTWADIHRAVQGGDLCPDGGRERIPRAIAARQVSRSDVAG